MNNSVFICHVNSRFHEDVVTDVDISIKQLTLIRYVVVMRKRAGEVERPYNNNNKALIFRRRNMENNSRADIEM